MHHNNFALATLFDIFILIIMWNRFFVFFLKSFVSIQTGFLWLIKGLVSKSTFSYRAYRQERDILMLALFFLSLHNSFFLEKVREQEEYK